MNATLPEHRPFHLQLPATSANLGPGFDAVGLAMALHLTISASQAPAFAIEAVGRDAGLCASLENNLILSTYAEVLAAAGRPVPPLHLDIDNQIPLGMGCGSSAAALLAGVFLADHFGDLGWPPSRILDEACRREGHPDNVAACFHGFMTVSATTQDGTTTAATCGADLDWRLLLALPRTKLATVQARALLPEIYTRAQAVGNVQATALLISAFALGRPELLGVAMHDNLHQPFRLAACPLLPLLLPLAARDGVYGVALSGAGPSVLLITDSSHPAADLHKAIQEAAGEHLLEIVETRISPGSVTEIAR